MESRLWDSNEWIRHPSIRAAVETLGVSEYSVRSCAKTGCRHKSGLEFRFPPTTGCDTSFAGEEWRKVDLGPLMKERAMRLRYAASQTWRLLGAMSGLHILDNICFSHAWFN